MTKSFLIMLTLLACAVSSNAQSKQELQSKIDQLTTKVAEQESTIQNLNGQLSALRDMFREEQAKNLQLQQQLLEAQQAKPSTQTQVKSSSPTDQIRDLVHKYASCMEWEEASQYVMEPSRVVPLMRQYYASTPFDADDCTDSDKIRKLTGKQHTLYFLKGNMIVETPEGYKIDWEATRGYNNLTFKDLTKAPGREFEFRFNGRSKCQLYACPSYSNTNWSVYQTFENYEERFLNAKANSTTDKIMTKSLEDHNALILKIKYDKASDSFIVTGVASENGSKY